MIIAVDFDGTCVTHQYPDIGRAIGARPILADLVKAGHKIILYTMRSGLELDYAVNWLKFQGIPLYGINENPGQEQWTSSRKVYADLYIDDAALGIPLKQSPNERPCVDWLAVKRLLIDRGIL